MEAIKGAVQHGLGAAFISSAAIKKELQLGLLCKCEHAGPGFPAVQYSWKAVHRAPLVFSCLHASQSSQ